MMKKIIGIFSFIAYMALAAFSSNAAAALVIDFQTGTLGAGGTITSDGPNVTGTAINIGQLQISGAAINNGTFVADAFLNFSTAADTIEIVGSVAGLGIGSGTVLLSGSFSSWSFGANGPNDIFNGTGPDIKDSGLLLAVGAEPGTPFNYFGFSVQSANGTAISTGIVNTAVPVPAAVWLFGSGLLGLVGVARRRA